VLRRFELAETPVRFWEIDYRSGRVVFRWGAVGGLVQTHARGFSTQLEATRHAEQQIATQTAKGYIEIGIPISADSSNGPSRDAPPRNPALTVERSQRFERGPQYLELVQEARRVVQLGGGITSTGDVPDKASRVVKVHRTVAEAVAAFDEALLDARHQGWTPLAVRDPATVHSNPELEAQCLESPDSPDAWAVLADWLIARGDPRGEIASLQLAGKLAEANRILSANLGALCGGDRECYALEYRHGFARHATLIQDPDDAFDDPQRTRLDAITREFLAAPMGRFVDSVRFGLAGFSDDNDWAPTLRAVAESPQASRIRELRFDAYTGSDCEISWAPFGDFTGLLAKLPALELLHLKSGAGGTLGDLELPALRTLIRESGGLAANELEAICLARWPNLEHLEIWFGSSNYGAAGSLSAIRSILDARGLPKLGHLGIVNCEFVDDAVDALAHSQLLPQLHSLDLSKGVMAGRGVRAFVANAPAFRHLASIDLSENLLDREEAARIGAVLDNVIIGKQRHRDEDYDDDEDGEEAFRYVAVGE